MKAVGKTQLRKVLLILLALVFLGAGMLPSFAIATHTLDCHHCAPETRTSCPVFIKLENTSSFFAVALLAFTCLVAVARVLKFVFYLLLDICRAPSLVGLGVRMNS